MYARPTSYNPYAEANQQNAIRRIKRHRGGSLPRFSPADNDRIIDLDKKLALAEDAKSRGNGFHTAEIKALTSRLALIGKKYRVSVEDLRTLARPAWED